MHTLIGWLFVCKKVQKKRMLTALCVVFYEVVYLLTFKSQFCLLSLSNNKRSLWAECTLI